MGSKLVLIANRNRIWAFDWYQNRWPWMTLNGVMAVILRYFSFSEFGSFRGALRKSSRSLSHLLMSSCLICHSETQQWTSNEVKDLITLWTCRCIVLFKIFDSLSFTFANSLVFASPCIWILLGLLWIREATVWVSYPLSISGVARYILRRKHKTTWKICRTQNDTKLECGPMPNVMVALPNIGDTLCSTPQSLADAYY